MAIEETQSKNNGGKHKFLNISSNYHGIRCRGFVIWLIAEYSIFMATFRTESIPFQHKRNPLADDHPQKPFIASFCSSEPTNKDSGCYVNLNGCAINPFIPEENTQYAVVVGEYHVFLYKLPVDLPEFSREAVMELDVSSLPNLKTEEGLSERKECLYAVTWCLEKKAHKIVCGGARGAIYVIDASTLKVDRQLIGHGDEIHDLRTCPKNPTLVLSASVDRTIRIFDIRVETCLLLFACQQGHIGPVYSADWSADAKTITSGGGDHRIVTWDLDAPEVREHLEVCQRKILRKQDISKLVNDSETASMHNSGAVSSNLQGHTLQVHHPTSILNDVHFDCVDCVRTIQIGAETHLMSRACSQERGITFWQNRLIDTNRVEVPENGISRKHVQHWFKETKDGRMYLSKFDIDPLKRWVAAGLGKGRVSFYKINDKESEEEFFHFKLHASTAQFHQVSFSRNGQILFCVAQFGFAVRFDRIPASFKDLPKNLW